MGTITQAPESERQTRPITQLEPDQQREACRVISTLSEISDNVKSNQLVTDRGFWVQLAPFPAGMGTRKYFKKMAPVFEKAGQERGR